MWQWLAFFHSKWSSFHFLSSEDCNYYLKNPWEKSILAKNVHFTEKYFDAVSIGSILQNLICQKSMPGSYKSSATEQWKAKRKTIVAFFSRLFSITKLDLIRWKQLYCKKLRIYHLVKMCLQFLLGQVIL